ncbi:MAG: hypothetical protein ACRDV1_14935, partial [Actinomycetes bacterium]
MPEQVRPPARDPAAALDSLLAAPGRRDRLVHVERIAARPGLTVPWPRWAHPDVVAALTAVGVSSPWRHQAEVAEHAYAGRSVVVSSGTASGKSLG